MESQRYSRGEKILKKREYQLRWKKGRNCRNRKYLVVGKVLREGKKYFKREGDRKFLRGRWKFWRSG